MTIDAPCAQTPAGFLTIGLGTTLDDATEAAISGIFEHLQRTLGYNRAEAAMLSSLVVDLCITQVVNGTVGVHALLPEGRFTKEKT
jgi:acetamidase/formamidase